MLKTPTANLGRNGGSQHPDKRKAGGHGPTLKDEVEWTIPVIEGVTHWGKYQPAISRWESVMGKAPAPNEVADTKSGYRFRTVFVEWMMGLPKGLVTESGIKHGPQLSALGNGVVPMQALTALEIMLSSFEVLEVAA